MSAKRKISSEVKTIGEVLRRPISYAVPIYQRDYAWTSEEIDALWQDLTEALEAKREEYFLGAVVLAPVENDTRRFEIVDGQQRLATLTMILAAIMHEWNQKRDTRGNEVFETYLGSKDRRSRETIAKLSLNSTNAELFQSLVIDQNEVTDAQKRTLSRSNQLICSAYRRVRMLLAEWLAQQRSVEEALVNLEEYLDENANVIVIEVGDETDAFILFETLNDRGLELAVSDLVKNYLFSHAGRSLETFKKSWTEIALLVGTENLPTFLRHFWLSEYRLLRERDLYRALREEIRSSAQAKRFLERLRTVAEFYAALLSPDHQLWGAAPGSSQRYIRALRLLRAAQYRPLAIAIMEGGKPDQVEKALRLLLAVTIRCTISGFSANDLERIYSNAAIAVRKSGKRNPKAIFDLVKDAYISDKDFEAEFQVSAFGRADFTRYVLGELNRALENNNPVEPTEDASLEHILPRNPGSDWKDPYPAEELDGWVGRIGNLTLLEKRVNRGIGNKAFKLKQAEAYAKSKLGLNADLRTLKGWTTIQITKRSRKLAKIATRVWRFDA